MKTSVVVTDYSYANKRGQRCPHCLTGDARKAKIVKMGKLEDVVRCPICYGEYLRPVD